MPGGNPLPYATLTPAPLAPSPAMASAPVPATETMQPTMEGAAVDETPAEIRADELPLEPARAAAPGSAGPLRGDRRDGGFIPPRPADAGPRLGNPNPDRFMAPAPEKKKGLFSRMFGGSAPVQPAPSPARTAPAPQLAAAPSQPTLGPVTVEPNRPKGGTGEDDVLDIPAFLRRKQS